ncbi:hypothetical protein NEHOM01_0424 [Nematocida homosporus]|uniref:uncharacterized protein n=1 Tax=Nematocida homosporus TaxID=1912981 RepID=UPI00222009E5|nr:uncharacterized protein NEHOM01_0424 [Nematocida homosporus]KAI5184822.1 hypothetical protein NEHOM01_0424 [Nematocida homosporus]
MSTPRPPANKEAEEKEPAIPFRTQFTSAFLYYTRVLIQVLVAVYSIVLVASTLGKHITKDNLPVVIPCVSAILFIVASFYLWRKSVQRSSLSRKKQHLFLCHSTILMLVAACGVFSGNGWSLFLVSGHFLDNKKFFQLLGAHILVFMPTLFLTSNILMGVVGLYPTIALMFVGLEEILSEREPINTYIHSQLFLGAISILFVIFSFSCIFLDQYVASFETTKLTPYWSQLLLGVS